MRTNYFDDSFIKEKVMDLHLNHFYDFQEDLKFLDHVDDFEKFYKNGKWHSKFDAYLVADEFDSDCRLDVLEIKQRVDDRRLYFIDETKLKPFQDPKVRRRWNYYFYFVLPDGVYALNMKELGIDWNNILSSKLSAQGIVRLQRGSVLRTKDRKNYKKLDDNLCYGLDVDVRFLGIKISDKIEGIDEDL